MNTVTIQQKQIVIDGKPVQLLSGGMHYFRVHPDLWDDRLDKAVAFGLNTIETYLCWNLHEPERGVFDFSGMLDLEAFIDKVGAHGLNLILRPGPYICAEWDNGGFPAWLTGIPGMELRRMYRPYLEAVEAYYEVILPKIKTRLHTRGGPVILVSVENEYGSYGHDKEYLEFLANLTRRHGIDVPLFTNDGPRNHHLLGGTLPGALVTMDFGSRSQEAWESKERLFPGTPDFCMEFWDGWFDHWGEKHHVRPATGSADAVVPELESMLRHGAHVNFYMFHGGTNFGFTNGANGNHFTDYAATVTSYDYDSPLSECGDPTEKFTACQEALRRHTKNPRIQPVRPTRKLAPGPVALTESADLLVNLDVLATRSGSAEIPPTMDSLGQNFGFIHYRKRLSGPHDRAVLRLYGINDFSQVWLNGRYLGSRMRDDGRKPFTLEGIGKDGALLDLLVENCGRINYGPFLGKDPKGITHAVTLEFQRQLGWEWHALPLARLDGLRFEAYSNEPGRVRFHRGYFDLAEPGDTFLRRPGAKGCAWVNGFHLGRYWGVGPTETLYVPAPVLRRGRNELVLLEQEELLSSEARFQEQPELGPTTTGH